ncbi:MAG: hypothetical protein KDH20_14600 [Rhodocyclaceae bacterium]|nr:hypothetical protein [Rhodocyclaceae bacterium]
MSENAPASDLDVADHAARASHPRSPWIVRLTIAMLGVSGISNVFALLAGASGLGPLILVIKATALLTTAAGLYSRLYWARKAASWLLALGCLNACLSLTRAANVAPTIGPIALGLTIMPLLWIWLTIDFIYGRKANAYFDACNAKPASPAGAAFPQSNANSPR